MQAFEAAARLGSFAAAAGELHLSPAAVSQRIRSLETHLGGRGAWPGLHDHGTFRKQIGVGADRGTDLGVAVAVAVAVGVGGHAAGSAVNR